MLNQKMQVEERDVRDFDRVVLRDESGSAEIFIEQGPEEKLRIEANLDWMRRIETDVRTRRLIITIGGSWLDRLSDKLVTSLTRSRVIYRLQVKELCSLDLFCANGVYVSALDTDVLSLNVGCTGNVNVRDLKAQQLNVDHAGAGRLEFSGRVHTQRVSMSGAGLYVARDLESQQASVRLSGSASAQVCVRGTLDVVVRGVGTVEYIGEPSVRQRIFGMGSVVRVRS